MNSVKRKLGDVAEALGYVIAGVVVAILGIVIPFGLLGAAVWTIVKAIRLAWGP